MWGFQNMEKNKIYQTDCIEGLKKLPDNSVDLIITSPPYEDISGAGYNGAKKDILFFLLFCAPLPVHPCQSSSVCNLKSFIY